MPHQLDLFPKGRLLAAMLLHADPVGRGCLSLKRLANASKLELVCTRNLLRELHLDSAVIVYGNPAPTVRYQIVRLGEDSQ